MNLSVFSFLGNCCVHQMCVFFLARRSSCWCAAAVRHHRLQSTAATSRLHTGCTQCTKEASDYFRLPLKAISSIFSNLFVSLTLLKDCKPFSEHSISPFTILFENVNGSVQKRCSSLRMDILSRLSTLWKSLHEEDINLCTLCVHVVVWWCARAFLLARLSVSKYAPVRPFRTQPGVVFCYKIKSGVSVKFSSELCSLFCNYFY